LGTGDSFGFYSIYDDMVFFDCGLYMIEIYFVENIRFTADLDFKYNSTFR